MKARKKQSFTGLVRGLLAQPANDFYQQPLLHINCAGQVNVENCRAVLEYTPELLRLDMGHWDAILRGNDLELTGLGSRLLTLQGQLFQMELSYRERNA